MADNADRAAELIERREAEALARRWRPSTQSERFCVDCGDEIPERRRTLGGVTRCLTCQEIHEARGNRND